MGDLSCCGCLHFTTYHYCNCELCGGGETYSCKYMHGYIDFDDDICEHYEEGDGEELYWGEW